MREAYKDGGAHQLELSLFGLLVIVPCRIIAVLRARPWALFGHPRILHEVGDR